jgi:hypothetical protein
MVINDRRKFIFVHVPKTAGTSMMSALAKLPGNNRRWVAKTKHETLAAFFAQWPQRRNLWDRLRGRNPEAYRTFAFVRNPWDRLSSLYRYMKEYRPIEQADRVRSFAEFVEQAADGVEWIVNWHTMRLQTDFFTFADAAGLRTMRLSFLGHFEHLSEDLAELSRQLGICLELPRENFSTNAHIDYRREYTERMLEAAGRLFATDAEFFGYSPGERAPARRRSGPLLAQC